MIINILQRPNTLLKEYVACLYMYESAISKNYTKNYSYTGSYIVLLLPYSTEVSDKWLRCLHRLVTTGFPFISDKWILWLDLLVTTGFPDSSK